MPGTTSSATPAPPSSIPSASFAPANRHAVSTPGDILFHIRAKRMDLCFELATQIMDRIGDASPSPTRPTASATSTIATSSASSTAPRIPAVMPPATPPSSADEDPTFAGGSYVIVQKYLHDMKAWNALSDRSAGTHHRPPQAFRHRTAATPSKPTYAHSALTTIEENGKELKILRDNMPFGQPGHGEFGTYFIGYCRTPRTTEQMLENMFVGRPPGNYDRLLDFSRAVTGSLFFAPSATFLDDDADVPLPSQALATCADHEAEPPSDTSEPSPSAVETAHDTSLEIGSLKGENE